MMRDNLMKVMRYAIMVTLFLSIAAFPSTAEITVKEKIVNNTESSITVVDEAGRTVTINLPVNNIISTDYRQMEALLALGARDMIVGVDNTFHKRMPYFGLKDVPDVSIHSQEVNYEQVLTLEPDLVIVPARQGATADEISEKLKGVPVIAMGLASRDHIIPETEIMGVILDKEDEASRLINWIKKYDGIVEERTQDLKPEDTPTFFYEYMSDLNKKWWAIAPNDPSAGRAAEGCGGRNIASELNMNETTTTKEVEAEWVLSKDPDYFFMDFMSTGLMSGPGRTEEEVNKNLTGLISDRENEGFSNLLAVKNNHIYTLNRDFISGPRWVIGHVCIAKWLHPDLFKDLSPDEMNKEYLKDFQGMELQGTWAYPAPK
ncbi:MAG: Cobalamin-binding protein precursor [Methanosaeta sp. PtaU1.Bin112]|nr:MAG: Cobalamin-binding protein precursor [Methanosaeta sp. PtaU1.Bin112]